MVTTKNMSKNGGFVSQKHILAPRPPPIWRACPDFEIGASLPRFTWRSAYRGVGVDLRTHTTDYTTIGIRCPEEAERSTGCATRRCFRGNRRAAVERGGAYGLTATVHSY